MSKFGDEFFRRLQRINAGLEPATTPGWRCARCNKDMSDCLSLFGPTPTDVCSECEIEMRKEDHLARWNAAKPPVYDIDAILFAADRKPWDIVKELNSKIDSSCPESHLLEPESIVRDFEMFSCFEGEDFDYILDCNGGAVIFLRGLRAMRAIGATRLADAMTKIRDFAISRGVALPDPIPDPWFCEVTIDSNLKCELARLDEELKPYDGLKGGDTSRMLVEYLRRHVEVLRQRKVQNEYS
ncbi:hypothetical protein FEM03_22275 [Phragmitibacter flavus]|uniref:Uncharacterized protein n=1 Tax=Phragmitibacter flavus TaxID=2576071 RepID=A0A5R8K864_9BACT|nr:hypothetical protein [Phragmitibacter flavus]TLD68534.1 hypothetical protein FEM03_22275 [Phragmitibacter flavus]